MKQTYYLQGNASDRMPSLKTYLSTKLYDGLEVLGEVEAESLREASEKFGLISNEVPT